MGDDKQKYIKEMNRSGFEAQQMFPEIFLRNFMRREKLGICQHTLNGPNLEKSTYITKEQCIDLHAAFSFANRFGVALNVHVTINWGLLGYLDHSEAAEALQEQFIDHMTSWYDSNYSKFDLHIPPELMWTYVHECPPNGDFHTHLVVGIPNEMRDKFRKWVKRRFDFIWKKKCKNDGSIKPRPKEVVKVVCPPSRPIIRQWILYGYMCKGLDPSATVEIPGYQGPVPMSNLIRSRFCNPGHIKCKKQIGMSRNLSKTTRNKFGFKSSMEMGVFDIREMYNSYLYDSWHREFPDLRCLKILNL